MGKKFVILSKKIQKKRKNYDQQPYNTCFFTIEILNFCYSITISIMEYISNEKDCNICESKHKRTGL